MYDSPLISVIIPVYNCEAFVRPSLSSLLVQTYKNFEVIIVDDCSTDQSMNIINGLVADNPQIPFKTIVNKQNLGEAKSRNVGLCAANGVYISFLDADDEYLPNFLYLMQKQISEGYDFVYCGFDILTMDDKIVRYERKRKYLDTSEKIIGQYLRAVNHFSHTAAIYRTNFLSDGNLFYNEESTYGVDIEFICNLLLLNPRCSCVKQSLYIYKLRANSLSTSITVLNIDDCMAGLSRVQRNIPSIREKARFLLGRKTNMAYHLLEEVYVQKLVGLNAVKSRIYLTSLFLTYLIIKPERIGLRSFKILFYFHNN